MKKILVPMDFSEVALNAFEHALEFAKTVNGELVLLYTYELPIVDQQIFPTNSSDYLEEIELSELELFKNELPKLETIAKRLNLSHIPLSHKILNGDLINNIKDSVRENNINFVVMGTAGAVGWKEIFVGTNTAEVMTSVEVPVLCVPLEAKYSKIETICFTTRYREKDKVALHQVLQFAKKANATVKCLYVKTEDTDNSEETFLAWQNEFKNEPVQFFILPSDDVKETILSFITHQEIDVIAILTYKRSFFESLFSPSFTKKIAYNFNIPILALHE